jgi:23S rRNA pseudouridine2605 synthase
VDKTYVAQVLGVVKPATVRRLLAGVELDDGPAAADTLVVKSTYAGRSIVELSLHEGRNRIVRRMLDAVGHPVEQLTRTAFGAVRLRDLKVGGSRELSRDELGALLDGVGL